MESGKQFAWEFFFLCLVITFTMFLLQLYMVPCIYFIALIDLLFFALNDIALDYCVESLFCIFYCQENLFVLHCFRFDFRILYGEFERNDMLRSNPLPNDVSSALFLMVF